MTINEQAAERLHFYANGWKLPDGTVESLLRAVQGLRDGEFILLGVAAACKNPQDWQSWLARSREPRIRAAALLLEARLSGPAARPTCNRK